MVENTVRAGVLEAGTMQLMKEMGVGKRMMEEGFLHHGIEFQFKGKRYPINFSKLVGKQIMIYPQHDVLKDLIAARLETGGKIIFEAEVVNIKDIETNNPKIEYKINGERQQIVCDFIAGCDGFHGPSRKAIPKHVLKEIEYVYPYNWLGILTEAPIANDVLIYSYHNRGFALISTRTPDIQRYYLQVDPEDEISDWPDDRIWEELHTRVDMEGWTLSDGPIIQKDMVKMRSFVCESMQYGRLFIAGDAAHIVPPTGAKGLNLAAGDAKVLAEGLEHYYRTGSEDLLNRYSETRLRTIWRAQRFSRLMTDLLHHHKQKSEFEQKIQLSDLDYLSTATAGATMIAENYTDISVTFS